MADPVLAVTARLKATAAVVATVGSGEARTSRGGAGSPLTGPWIFNRLALVDVPTTQKAMIIVTAEGNWSTPIAGSRQSFPRIRLLIVADYTRNDDLTIIPGTAMARATTVFDACDEALLDIGTAPSWDGQRILACTRLTDPRWSPPSLGFAESRTDYGLRVG